jgi:hypothetical protein
MVSRVIDDVVSLAVKCAETRATDEGRLMLANYLEWKTLFLAGVPQVDPDNSAAEEEEVLNSEDVRVYADVEGVWAAAAAGVVTTGTDFVSCFTADAPSLLSSSSSEHTATTEGDVREVMSESTVSDAAASVAPASPASALADDGGANADNTVVAGAATADGTLGGDVNTAAICAEAPKDEALTDGTDAMDVPPPNRVLGHVVYRLHTTVEPPPTAPELPSLPKSRLRVAVVGKAFSGSSEAVAAVCNTLGATVISPTALIDRAIRAAKEGETEVEYCEEHGLPAPPSETPVPESSYAQLSTVHPSTVSLFAAPLPPREPTDNAPSAAPSRRAVVGRAVLDAVESGRAASVNDVIELIVLALQCVDPAKGWVLDNFPSTEAEARLFERRIAGYDEEFPDPYANMSALAPVVADEQRRPALEHGFAIDALVCVEADDSLCIRRAVGRRRDPETGEVRCSCVALLLFLLLLFH